MLCAAGGLGLIFKNGCKSRLKCFLFGLNIADKKGQTLALSLRFHILSKKSAQTAAYRVFCGSIPGNEKDAKLFRQYL
jgi:hypothetical protein